MYYDMVCTMLWCLVYSDVHNGIMCPMLCIILWFAVLWIITLIHVLKERSSPWGGSILIHIHILVYSLVCHTL